MNRVNLISINIMRQLLVCNIL